MPVITLNPAASRDDGSIFGGADGVSNPPDTDFFMNVSSTVIDVLANSNNIRTFVRFPAVSIPNAATINSASIQYLFSSSKAPSSNNTFVLAGHAADNSAQAMAPTGSSNDPAAIDIRNRPFTSAQLSLTMVSGTSLTYTVTAIVQEIVNRPGWASGNAMMLFTQAGARTGSATKSFYSFDNGSSLPTLTIDYTAGVTPPPAAVEPGRFFLSP